MSLCYLFHECPKSEHNFLAFFTSPVGLYFIPKHMIYYIIIVLLVPNGMTHAVVPNQEVLSILMHLY